MSKKKKDEDEKVSGTDASHFSPQEETGPPARPEAVHSSHLKPQEEVEIEEKRVRAVDPSHLKPQAE
jgi:hypothetical protein